MGAAERPTCRSQRAAELFEQHRALRAACGRGEMPLRIYLVRESTRALLKACLASVALVCAAVLALAALGARLSGPAPALLICLAVCALTLGIGVHAMARNARAVARPVELVAEATDRIARGDFEARVDERAGRLAISEFRDLVDRFNQMAEALAGMDYMRRDFTSSVSHEFKTPIAAIAGMSELVADPQLPEGERAECLSLIREQALRLSTLCERILDMTRLDNQAIVNRRERTDVDEQIRRDAIVLQERWADAGIEVELDLAASPVETDPGLTHQVWLNLMDNAFKYGRPGGHVWVTSRDVATGEGAPEGVEVVVRDDGLGMSAEQAARAFERFYQADPSRSRQGCGLGLAIARRVVDLLGGSIACESAEGCGTAMTVRLPREPG